MEGLRPSHLSAIVFKRIFPRRGEAPPHRPAGAYELPGLSGRVAGTCVRCGLMPQQLDGVLCGVCDGAARARRVRRRRARAIWRWSGASLLDGLLGVGVGALALWPAVAGPGSLAVAAILATVLAMTALFAHAWVMRTLLRRWVLWAAIAGGELLAHWVTVATVAMAVGYMPGLLAVCTALTGSAAALLQARALVGDAPEPWRWAVGSTMVWLAAGGTGLVAELVLHSSLAGVIAGAALGRLIHGMLAGPILAWVVVPSALRG